MAMLEVENIHTYYGNIHALKGVSLTVDQGEIVTLIGANGSGKSTTLRTITGILKPLEGHVRLEGEDLLPYKAHELVDKGIAMVPEGRRIFARLTVAENLDMGAYSRNNRQEIAKDLERVYSLFPRLRERRNQIAGTLSGGEQQRVAIARALANNPKVLLADEPTGNLDSIRAHELLALMREMVNQDSLTILMVTHDQELANSFADRIVFMKDGRIVL